MNSFSRSAFAADALTARITDILDEVPALGRPGPWALLDWPAHGNVGDSAIWAGTLALLTPRFGRPPSFVSRCGRYPAGLDRVMPEGPILLNGGGNFGDVWPDYHEVRMRLLAEMRHRSIVQLPQSVHYQDPRARAEMARAIAGHPDFTLMVRDLQSLQIARTHFDCRILLCPDMAYGLGHIGSAMRPEVDVFCLLRDDRERAGHGVDHAKAAGFGTVGDWTDRPAKRARSERRLLKHLSHLPRKWAGRLEQVACARIAAREVQRGADILARGRVVLTDRLHGHILCVLMGKPHVVLDNSYGKIGAFIDSWPADVLTHRAGGHVKTQLEELVGRVDAQEMR